MDDHGRFGSWGIRHCSYVELPPPPKINLNRQLMPRDGDVKPFFSNGSNFPADVVWEGWMNHRDNKNTHTRTTKFLDMQSQVDKVSVTEERGNIKAAPLKKAPQGKPKKPEKLVVPKKSKGLVIDGIDFDLLRIPTPVCSCTGEPRQCYKWGVGGWQSVCCTKSVSEYPLPASMKRRGARIAGRKMSLGAFKKVLEAVVREGHALSNPIDLKPYWAKHGTNKFVTIR